MIYFVRFYFNVPNFVHPNPKAADNPKTLNWSCKLQDMFWYILSTSIIQNLYENSPLKYSWLFKDYFWIPGFPGLSAMKTRDIVVKIVNIVIEIVFELVWCL